MDIIKKINKFCTPAMVYLYISFLALLFLLFKKTNIIKILIKAIFILFWTFLLNMLCNNGYKFISWFLVLFPFVIMLAACFMTFLHVEEGFYVNTTSTQPNTLSNLEKSATIANAISENAQLDIKKTIDLATIRANEAEALEAQLNAKKIEVNDLLSRAKALEPPSAKAADEAKIANERLNIAKAEELREKSFALASGH